MAKEKAAKKPTPAKKGPIEIKPGPRQQRLPEMEDPKIQSLEDKTLEYAEVRDQRMSLSHKEAEFKGQLLQLMKAQKREHYHHGTIRIDIVHEKENIKVKVKAAGEEEEDDE